LSARALFGSWSTYDAQVARRAIKVSVGKRVRVLGATGVDKRLKGARGGVEEVSTQQVLTAFAYEELVVKRIAVVLVLGVAVFGAVFAFAASLTVNSKSLAAGSGSVAACNASAAVSYNTVYSAALPGFQVTTAPVTSAAGCANMPYTVTLTGAANASLGSVTGTLTATGTASPDFTSANVNAANVTGVSVVISG